MGRERGKTLTLQGGKGSLETGDKEKEQKVAVINTFSGRGRSPAIPGHTDLRISRAKRGGRTEKRESASDSHDKCRRRQPLSMKRTEAR